MSGAGPAGGRRRWTSWLAGRTLSARLITGVLLLLIGACAVIGVVTYLAIRGSMVTALDGRADRIAGLEAGADEFLTKPIEDVMLFARVRSLTRLKVVLDELRERESTGRRRRP